MTIAQRFSVGLAAKYCASPEGTAESAYILQPSLRDFLLWGRGSPTLKRGAKQGLRPRHSLDHQCYKPVAAVFVDRSEDSDEHPQS